MMAWQSEFVGRVCDVAAVCTFIVVSFRATQCFTLVSCFAPCAPVPCLPGVLPEAWGFDGEKQQDSFLSSWSLRKPLMG